MDPNVTLFQILTIVGDAENNEELYPEDGLFADLVRLVGALDDWLEAGGFLPERWQSARGTS